MKNSLSLYKSPLWSFGITLSVMVVLALSLVGTASSAESGYSSVWVDRIEDTPDPVLLGKNVTYKIFVNNSGSEKAVNAVIKTYVPKDSRLVSYRLDSSSDKRSCEVDDKRQIECFMSELDSQQVATLTLVVHPNSTGTLQLGAAATADNSVGGATPQEYLPTTTQVVAPSECTVVGTELNDQLKGTPKRDVICAFDGNDGIHSREGNDIVLGGGGQDVVHGGKGRDQLVGGPGSDSLFGGAGKDSLDARDGTESNDVLYGGRGRDSLLADSGDRVKQDQH